jgi:hypothetical protein
MNSKCRYPRSALEQSALYLRPGKHILQEAAWVGFCIGLQEVGGAAMNIILAERFLRVTLQHFMLAMRQNQRDPGTATFYQS